MARTALTGLATFLWMVLCLWHPVQAEDLSIGGTGSSTPLVQLLFDEFRKREPNVSLHLISPPMGSNGALKALKAGRIDLAVLGRPVSPEEFSQFGQHFDLADTPFVMASRDGQRKTGFTLDQLASVYSGNLLSWDTGAPIRLVIRGSFESDTLLLKTMSDSLARAVDAAAKRPGMASAVNDIDTAALIAKTPGSLGPTTLGLLTTLGLRITVYPLNGVAPSLANMKSAKYPWRKTLTIVLPLRPSTAATAFAAFLRTPAAQAVMLRNDYLPARP